MALTSPRGAAWSFLTFVLLCVLFAAILGTKMSWLAQLLCPMAGVSLLSTLFFLSTRSPDSPGVLADEEKRVREMGVKCRDVYAKAFGFIPVPGRGTLFVTSKRLACVLDGETSPAWEVPLERVARFDRDMWGEETCLRIRYTGADGREKQARFSMSDESVTEWIEGADSLLAGQEPPEQPPPAAEKQVVGGPPPPKAAGLDPHVSFTLGLLILVGVAFVQPLAARVLPAFVPGDAVLLLFVVLPGGWFLIVGAEALGRAAGGRGAPIVGSIAGALGPILLWAAPGLATLAAVFTGVMLAAKLGQFGLEVSKDAGDRVGVALGWTAIGISVLSVVTVALSLAWRTG